jgi:hypothetical protein
MAINALEAFPKEPRSLREPAACPQMMVMSKGEKNKINQWVMDGNGKLVIMAST